MTGAPRDAACRENPGCFHKVATRDYGLSHLLLLSWWFDLSMLLSTEFYGNPASAQLEPSEPLSVDIRGISSPSVTVVSKQISALDAVGLRPCEDIAAAPASGLGTGRNIGQALKQIAFVAGNHVTGHWLSTLSLMACYLE
jgi:hypothetical protein